MKNRLFNTLYVIFSPVLHLLFPVRVSGKKNLPAGAAIVCANHSHAADPILLCLAFGRKTWLHFMAKAELFAKPLLGNFLKKIGAFPVNRGEADIGAVRTAMKLLKSGEKVMMFPEGTRVSTDDAVAAKSGAVRIAAKLSVPIVPVNIPRKKRLFVPSQIVVGEPYFVSGEKQALQPHMEQSAEELMKIINGLGK